MTTMRERIARAIGMTECDDGDPLGVALAENFRIEDGCESAAEVRAALDALLLRAADAVLEELMQPSKDMIPDAETAFWDVVHRDDPGAMLAAWQAAIRAAKEGT